MRLSPRYWLRRWLCPELEPSTEVLAHIRDLNDELCKALSAAIRAEAKQEVKEK